MTRVKKTSQRFTFALALLGAAGFASACTGGDDGSQESDCEGEDCDDKGGDGDGDGDSPVDCGAGCENADPDNCVVSCEVEGGEPACVVTPLDEDGDGHGTNACLVSPGGDCDDEDEEISPEAVEVCDGIDNDCNGRADATDGLALSAMPLPWAPGSQARVVYHAAGGKYGLAWAGDEDDRKTLNYVALDPDGQTASSAVLIADPPADTYANLAAITYGGPGVGVLWTEYTQGTDYTTRTMFAVVDETGAFVLNPLEVQPSVDDTLRSGGAASLLRLEDDWLLVLREGPSDGGSYDFITVGAAGATDVVATLPGPDFSNLKVTEVDGTLLASWSSDGEFRVAPLTSNYTLAASTLVSGGEELPFDTRTTGAVMWPTGSDALAAWLHLAGSHVGVEFVTIDSNAEITCDATYRARENSLISYDAASLDEKKVLFLSDYQVVQNPPPASPSYEFDVSVLEVPDECGGAVRESVILEDAYFLDYAGSPDGGGLLIAAGVTGSGEQLLIQPVGDLLCN